MIICCPDSIVIKEKQVPTAVYIRLYLLTIGLDTPETCRGWRNIRRISCASSWFFVTRLYRDARSTKYKRNYEFKILQLLNFLLFYLNSLKILSAYNRIFLSKYIYYFAHFATPWSLALSTASPFTPHPRHLLWRRVFCERYKPNFCALIIKICKK